jgi:Ca2+-binding EF-hand superfamily protein
MKLWILALALIASPALAAEKPNKAEAAHIAELKARFDQAFKTIDTNADGKISKEEAAQKAPSLAANFDAVDTNKDGSLSKKEIWDAQQKMTQAIRQANENFSRTLAQADKNNDGKLSKEEVQASPELAKLSQGFDQIDGNHDGFLVLPEILGFMQARVQAQMRAAGTSGTPSTVPAGK